MSEDIIGTVDWQAVYDVLTSWNIRLVLAFPGTGKTSCVKHLRKVGKRGGPPVVADFDIKGVGNDIANVDLIPKSQRAMGELVNQFMLDNVIVFSFMHYFNLDCINPGAGSVLVTYPEATPNEWAERIRERGDSDAFVDLVRQHLDEWKDDWVSETKTLAKRLKVIVVPVHADEYLSDAILSLGRYHN
jgi:hypothetical protein